MPKLTKPQKEKAPNTKQKKARIPKNAPQKGKTAKTPKVKRNSPFFKNKKAMVQLAAVLMFVIIGSAAAIILLTIQKRGTAKEKVPEAPLYYFSKDEGISSITEVVGKRDFTKLTVPETNQEDTKGSESQESGSQAAKESSTDKTAQADGQEEKFEYLHVEDISGDLESYRSYLEGEKSFIDVTDKTQLTAGSSEDSSKDDSSDIYHFAGPSKDSDSYLSITLESNTDSYIVTACKEKQPWSTYFKDLWNEQKKIIADYEQAPKATNTIEQAENTVRSQGQEKLGLSETADSYEYIAAPGLANIDGKNYYTVRTYKRQPDNTLIYIATYLYDYNTSNVAYQFDEITRKTTPLSTNG